MSPRTRRGDVDRDELARLEEERRFLLRSIADLERERAFGDLDDDDYRTVLDGYTARAAAVLRQIEAGRAALPERRPARWGRIGAVTAVVVALAVLSGWLVARSSGQRLAGQVMTGGLPVDEVSALLAEARAALGVDPFTAAGLYQQVIAIEPQHPEARTYTAWLLALSASGAEGDAAEAAITQAVELFEAVIASHPDYADAHCLYAVAAARFLAEPDLALAQRQAQACLDLDPPSDMRGLVESFLAAL